MFYEAVRLADPNATEYNIRRKILDQLGHTTRKVGQKSELTREPHSKKRPTAAELAERKRKLEEDDTAEGTPNSKRKMTGKDNASETTLE